MYNKGVSESNKINLKGILVGNGVADWDYDTTNAMLDFAFTHHITSYESRLEFNKYCIMEFDYSECERIVYEIEDWLENINIYDYLRECETPTTEDGEINYFSSYFLKAPWAFKHLKEKQEMMKNKKPNKNINKNNIKERINPPCMDDTNMYNYFNRDDVKSALHVKMDKEWELCSYDINTRYERLDKGSIWTYPTIISSGIRVLIFNGDTDMSVPYNGNQAWIKNLKLEIEKP